ERALGGNDPEAALAAAARGLAGGASGEIEADLWALRTRAAWLVGNLALALTSSKEAIERAKPGSLGRCPALAGAVSSALTVGRAEELSTAIKTLLVTVPAPDAITPITWGLSNTVIALIVRGQCDAATVFLGRLRMIANAPGADESARATLAYA